MKKILMVFLSLFIAVSMAGCADGGDTSNVKKEPIHSEGLALNAEGDGWSIQANGDQLKLTVDANHVINHRLQLGG